MSHIAVKCIARDLDDVSKTKEPVTQDTQRILVARGYSVSPDLPGFGVTKDQARGVSLFRQAANRGNPGAMFDLGLVYFSGVGVRQDKATALRWFTRAADLGIAQAQDMLGYMYEEGDGVTQSDQQAMAWYRKSAAQGDPFGTNWQGLCTRHHNREKQREERGRTREDVTKLFPLPPRV